MRSLMILNIYIYTQTNILLFFYDIYLFLLKTVFPYHAGTIFNFQMYIYKFNIILGSIVGSF